MLSDIRVGSGGAIGSADWFLASSVAALRFAGTFPSGTRSADPTGSFK